MENRVVKPMKSKIIAGIIAIFVVIMLFSSIRTVPVGHTGIQIRFGRVMDGTLVEGVNFVIPFVDRVVSVDNRMQRVDLYTEVFSRDLQEIIANITINYQIDQARAYNLFRYTGVDYSHILIEPAAHEALQSAIANYTAEELFSRRAEVSRDIEDKLLERLYATDITIRYINVMDFNFSQQFIRAVEEKQIADQRMQQAQIENQMLIERAEADAQQAVIQANAEAERLLIEAKAMAESFRLQNEALTEMNLQLEWLQRWDGRLPQVSLNESNGMIFDISSVVSD
ncbi:MAG: prohibitin family protein [Defluviitaleaceae bacterium]|nr:prohibitin family protein [Defluviitaleaceae bacterium]